MRIRMKIIGVVTTVVAPVLSLIIIESINKFLLDHYFTPSCSTLHEYPPELSILPAVVFLLAYIFILIATIIIFISRSSNPKKRLRAWDEP